MTRKKASKKPNRVNSGSYNNNTIDDKSLKQSVKKTTKNGLITHRIKGLSNLGNTCYFNSMLQMILNCPTFFTSLKSFISSDSEINIKSGSQEVRLVLKEGDVSCVERELVKIAESESAVISPSPLRNALLKNDQFRTHFSGFNEQDSHEAFLMTLNVIKEAQVKRIKKAILEKFNCLKNIDKLTDEMRAEIKSLGALAEKQTLVHSHFGLVIGSALRCCECNVMRMRFDECFHLSPQFPSQPSGQKRTECIPETPLPTKSENVDQQPQQKMSKHQQKRLKRIERKTARNKKSTLRNVEISSTNEDCDNPEKEANPTVPNPLLERFLNESFEPLEQSSNEVDEFNEIHGTITLEDDNNNSTDLIDLINPPNQVTFNNTSESQSSHAALGSGSSRSSLRSDPVESSEAVPEEEAITDQFKESLSLEDPPVEEEIQDENEEKDKDSPIFNNSTSLPQSSSSSSSALDRIDAGSGENLQNVLTSTLENHMIKWNRGEQTDLDRALERLIYPLEVENLVCDHCTSDKSSPVGTTHVKSDIICHLPLILPIYISRFKQTSFKNKSSKNNQFYSYPFLLDLSLQCSQYANVGDDLSSVVYRLYGIIEHIGARINSGHYVSYVCSSRDKDVLNTKISPQSYSSNILADICKKHEQKQHHDQQFPNGNCHQVEFDTDSVSNYQWFRISDSQVESVSSNTVMNCQAFMLFYIRVA